MANKFISVKVKGLNEAINMIDKTDVVIRKASVNAITKAISYLQKAVKARFGTYQATGGSGNGPWQKLKYPTIVRKRKEGFGANANKPLLRTGAMRDSIKVKTKLSNDKRLQAVVYSDDPKLVHHVFGAPRAGVPRRDPIAVTVKEEDTAVLKIFEEELDEELRRLR